MKFLYYSLIVASGVITGMLTLWTFYPKQSPPIINCCCRERDSLIHEVIERRREALEWKKEYKKILFKYANK